MLPPESGQIRDIGLKRPRADPQPPADFVGPQLRVLIPLEAKEKVIGTRGATIKDIAKATLTHMNISKEPWPGSPALILTVTSKQSCELSVVNVPRAVAKALEVAYCEAGMVPDVMHIVVILPVWLGPFIVGKGGQKVQELQKQTGCFISLKRPPPGSEDEEMQIQGSFEGVFFVLQAICAAHAEKISGGIQEQHPVASRPRRRGGDEMAFDAFGGAAAAPSHLLGSQPAREPDRMRPPAFKPPPILPPSDYGGGLQYWPELAPQVDEAAEQVNDSEVLSCECFVKMQLPSALGMGVLIGRGGSFMKTMREESGAHKLHIENDSGGRWLEIHGSLAQVHTAQLIMMRKILEVMSKPA